MNRPLHCRHCSTPLPPRYVINRCAPCCLTFYHLSLIPSTKDRQRIERENTSATMRRITAALKDDHGSLYEEIRAKAIPPAVMAVLRKRSEERGAGGDKQGE